MVHQYKLNGYNIVLDTCSGSVHTVDEVAYDVIEMYKTHTAEQIVETLLRKHADKPDVTREELLECIEDVKALEAAGKTADQVRFTKAHLDNDDGRLEWEIEFVQGGMEYEFDIDARTAAVLEMDIDRAD